jgi:hypothetical protein
MWITKSFLFLTLFFVSNPTFHDVVAFSPQQHRLQVTKRFVSTSSSSSSSTATKTTAADEIRKIFKQSNSNNTNTKDQIAQEWDMTEALLNPLAHHYIKGPKECLVFDTTLRDGTQGEAVSASCDDKLKIASRLSTFDVDYIEAGWPGSNPKDAEFFRRAQTELKPETRAKLVAFGSSRRKNVAVEKDVQIQALVDSNVPTVCMVVKAHPWQVTEILRATREENLEMIHDSVEYLVKLGKTVLVDL